MCGIAAIVSVNGAPASRLQLARMASVMRHRGPDSGGFWIHDWVGFAFRRLSIQDLSAAGNQPMTSIDGRYTIIFNGEIYNFIEIRERLQGLGYSFRSSGDTEVLLNAFAEWGWNCLTLLNGMWAFLIFDQREGRLHGARDRFGIKPLFFQRTPRQLLFGSEIKAIRANTDHLDSVDWQAASAFLGAPSA